MIGEELREANDQAIAHRVMQSSISDSLGICQRQSLIHPEAPLSELEEANQPQNETEGQKPKSSKISLRDILGRSGSGKIVYESVV
jgi:hypothetical protein